MKRQQLNRANLPATLPTVGNRASAGGSRALRGCGCRGCGCASTSDAKPREIDRLMDGDCMTHTGARVCYNRGAVCRLGVRGLWVILRCRRWCGADAQNVRPFQDLLVEVCAAQRVVTGNGKGRVIVPAKMKRKTHTVPCQITTLGRLPL
jgi:hypothetical protein